MKIYLLHLLNFSIADLIQLHISYKPQKISPKSQGLVRQLLHEKIRDAYVHPQVSPVEIYLCNRTRIHIRNGNVH